MKKALIICNQGMSSSFMAKKTTEYLKNKGADIEIAATTIIDGERKVQANGEDLYLVSPQARMIFDRLKKIADENGAKIAQIPFEAYAPVEPSIAKLAALVERELSK